MTMSENTSVSEMAYNMEHELAIAMNALHDMAYFGAPSSHWLSGDNARARRALKELGNDNE